MEHNSDSGFFLFFCWYVCLHNHYNSEREVEKDVFLQSKGKIKLQYQTVSYDRTSFMLVCSGWEKENVIDSQRHKLTGLVKKKKTKKRNKPNYKRKNMFMTTALLFIAV